MQSERDTAAREELWRTLVRQLRALFAERVLKQRLEKAHFDEPFDGEFLMAAESGFLSVWLHVEDGTGSWNCISERLDMAEPWSMSVDGEVEFRGEKMDLLGVENKFLDMVSPQ